MAANRVGQTVSVDRSFGALVRTETQSGIPVKVVYTPEDIKHLEYERDLAEPGDYPYTRGIYPEMYRNKLWLRSVSIGYSTPEETNEGFKEFIAAGANGLRMPIDLPSQTGIDPDHPSAFTSLTVSAPCIYSLAPYEKIVDGLPMENVDYEYATNSISGSLLLYSCLIAVMEKRGLNIATLRGNNVTDPFRAKVVYGVPDFPNEIAKRVCLDLVEFGAKNTPKWRAFAPNGVDPCQAGANAIQELMFCMGGAIAIYEDLIRERGMKLDDIGATVIALDAESDFFETIAKFRAARRMWARIAKERLGATTPRAMSLRIGIRTSGLSLTAQKPLNNAARITLQVLSCVLGGVNSMDVCGMDEAIGILSNEARMFNIDTEHIITHEANIPLTADPLGGSYYLEWLTDKLEKETNKLLEEIDSRGGMWQCLESGWLNQQIEASRLKVQQEQSTGKRLIVGVNAFQGEDGPISKTIVGTAYKVPSRKARLNLIKEVKELRKNRDQQRVSDALKGLYQATREGRNVVPLAIETLKAYATYGELVGVIRMAYNYGYDPLVQISEPAFIRRLIGDGSA